VARRAWNLPGVVGLLAVCIAAPASPQGNIDAGKTPAQLFSSTCTACHRRPQELKRSSAGFLRQHYMSSSEEAAAMASYLAGVGSDPRAVKDRGKDRGKPQQPTAKAQAQAQAQSKGKRPTEPAKAAKQQPEPEPAPEAPEVARAPALEPFEE
jgi:organic hydroperoxide reductase OsmC/OhrA